MFIVWGRKRTERKLGFIADFCPICRGVQAFQAFRIGSVGHIYYISFGSGELVGHIIRCIRCEQAFATDPMRYSSMQPRASADVDELTLATFPNLAAVYADRIAIETQIKRSPGLLSPEERGNLILEPFGLLNPAVEECFRETKFDRQSGTGCLGSLVIFAVVFGIAMALKEPMQGYMLMAAMSFLGIGTLYTFIQLGLGPRRRLHTKLLPALAHSLDPLEPTMEELSVCLAKCKAAGMKMGKKVKLQALWAELQKRATTIREDQLAR